MNMCRAFGCTETKNLTVQHVTYSPERKVFYMCSYHNKLARDLEQVRGDRDQRAATKEMIEGFPYEDLELHIVGYSRSGPPVYGNDRFNVYFVNGGAHGTVNPTIRIDDLRGREYRDWILTLPHIKIDDWRDRNKINYQELTAAKILPVKVLARENRKFFRCVDSDGIDSLINLDTQFIPSVMEKLNNLPERTRRETAKVAEFFYPPAITKGKFYQEALFG